MLIGALLRFGGIGAESLWHDEALTTVSARVPISQVIHSVRYSENCPPAYFILINVWNKLTPDSEAMLRLPSALLGIAGIVTLFLLGRELFDPRVGLTAAALLALSPFHIAYSQEARPYALLFLLLLLCCWAVVRMLRTGSPWAQAAYVATAAAAMYTQTFAVFTLIVFNLFYAVRLFRKPTRVSLRSWIMLQLAVIVLFGPWVPATLEVARMGLPWMLKATPFHEAMAAYAGGWIAVIVMAIAGLLAVSIAGRKRDDRILLPLAIAMVPVLGPVLYGIFTPRYGISALIGVTLLVAYAAANFGRAACAALVLLAAINWTATSQLGHARYPGFTLKPDIRSVAKYLSANASPGEVLMNRADGFHGRALSYYFAGSAMRLTDQLPGQPPRRVWVMASDAAVPSDLPYALASKHASDGLVLLELLGKPPATAATTEPVTQPGR